MTTYVIVAVLLFGCLMVVTESLTKINKAAVAIFVGTVGWMLYITNGASFVVSQHPEQFASFLNGASSTDYNVMEFIARHIFIRHVGQAAEIVLFLLSTMTIVEILSSNGCFDFISHLLRTRNSRHMLWILTGVTFFLSANLDNLTTTVMMLTIMNKMVPDMRSRMIFGVAIVIAANGGGALTVIGDPSGLLLWNQGAVTPTNYTLSMAIPCMVACALTVWWLGRALPPHVGIQWQAMPYRGDDTRLNSWQRVVMLFVGIGGLWFIPTFHSITHLSPFLGSLCVLALLWIVNEVMNRGLMNSNLVVQRGVPSAMQYGVMQMMLFVVGVMLAVGVVQETGAVDWFISQSRLYINDPWLMGIAAVPVSAVLDNFATLMAFFTLSPGALPDDSYWVSIAYASAVGGSLLPIGSVSGIALMKMERMPMAWFIKNVFVKVLVGIVAGFLVLRFLTF